MSDEPKTSISSSVHNLSISQDKETDKGNEGAVNVSFLFKPAIYAIDEWLSTSTKNSPATNKYTITSTGNGNVDISGK